MNILTLDVETTISNKGNPFDLTNKLVVIGLKWLGQTVYNIYNDPENDPIRYIQDEINKSDLLVGFNIKFDLHHLRRAGIDISKVKVWDCQIAEFLLENQTNPYPSLDQACEKYGFPLKLDIVKTEYWAKGIDTDKVPRPILSEYLEGDLIRTEQVYLKQISQLEAQGKMPLFRLQCQDLLVLEEYEWNGIKFNTEKARAKAEEIFHELAEIIAKLSVYTNGVPVNFNSNDHLSCLLYGGIITIPDRIPVGVFKTGAKIGETRYKIIEKHYELPRLTEPLKGTETKWAKVAVGDDGEVYIDKDKPTHWKTNADVLRSLKLSKTAKAVVGLLNRYSELEKLRGTYLLGWSDLIDKMHWEKDTIHGNLNQCTVITGRLSSTKPNLQNADPFTKTFMETRY